jgi:flagellar assembly protein FliH
VATPLSNNIIKARLNSDISTFDFREISIGKVERPPAEEPPPVEEAVEEEEVVAVDPLAELEETIRNRLLEAERHAQEIEKEAYEKGYAQGQKDGLEYGAKSMKIIKEHLEQLLPGFQALPEQVFKDYRNWFIGACLTFVKKVAPKVVEMHPQGLIRLIGAFLDEAEEQHLLTIYLHPSDMSLLEKHTDLMESLRAGSRSFAVKADPAMKRGGCRAENDIQLLDATMETQLALFEEALRQNGPDSNEPPPSE